MIPVSVSLAKTKGNINVSSENEEVVVTAASITGFDIPKCLHDIPIVKLGRGQSINLDISLVEGYGKNHARFSPVSKVKFRRKKIESDHVIGEIKFSSIGFLEPHEIIEHAKEIYNSDITAGVSQHL